MRPLALSLVLASLLAAAPAYAETLSAPPSETSAALRLTEAEARDRIQETGYTQVSDLRMDERGLWHGRASRNGDPREVSLDAQGRLQDSWELAALTMFDRETGDIATAANPSPPAGAATLVVQVSN